MYVYNTKQNKQDLDVSLHRQPGQGDDTERHGQAQTQKDTHMYIIMLNKNTWGVKKCGANQKQHCKQAGATKRFDIS